MEWSLVSLISPGTTSRRQMIGVWSFSEMCSWMAVLPEVRRAWATMPEDYGTGQNSSSEVGPFLVITVGPNQVDIPKPGLDLTIPSRGDQYVDAIAHYEGPKSGKRADIGVEIKFTRRTSAALNDAVNQVASALFAEGTPLHGAIIVTNGIPSPMTVRRLDDFPKIRIVTWNDIEDSPRILAAIMSLAEDM
jgi:hypothetical protein